MIYIVKKAKSKNRSLTCRIYCGWGVGNRFLHRGPHDTPIFTPNGSLGAATTITEDAGVSMAIRHAAMAKLGHSTPVCAKHKNKYEGILPSHKKAQTARRYGGARK